MEIIQTVVLGAIQGLTEFIPISSSAHLVIIRWVFGWDTQDLVLDVSLHLGTLFALLAYFWREWYEIGRQYISMTRIGRRLGLATPSDGTQAMLLWPLVFACIPGAVAGVLLEDAAANAFRSPVLIATTLIGMGLLLFVADRIGKNARTMESVRARDWIVIGLAQALAIIPGVSRSGITITAGLFCGLRRDASARFSFLLGAPIIFGAAVYELRHLFRREIGAQDIIPLILGVTTATAVGYVCIGFLMRYLKEHRPDIFVLYRVLVGLILIAAYFFGGFRG